MITLLEKLEEAKFPYWRETICLFEGGSSLHGARGENSDLDICGVYVEPPHKIIGVDSCEHFTYLGAEHGTGMDIALYGLQKFAMMACRGNPTVIQFLFAKNTRVVPPDQDTWFHGVWSNRRSFLCRRHGKQYLGFASAQLMRMTGERSRNVNRPDLVEKHGYDTKYAMHVIRLLAECEELLTTGGLDFPNREVDLLLSIRRGERTEDWVIREATRRFDLCNKAMDTSVLPAEINRNLISTVIADAYRRHWQKWRL